MSWLLTVVAAFEWSASSSSGAALASRDWRLSASATPVLLCAAGRVSAAVAWEGPHGLADLHAGRVVFATRGRAWAAGVCASTLNLRSYGEHDLTVGACTVLPCSVAAGVGLHGLLVQSGSDPSDFAPALDLGVTWWSPVLSAAVAVRRLNGPRFGSGDELPACIAAGIGWQPIPGLQLVLDAEREGGFERLRVGFEVAPASPLRLRAGVCTEPLHYTAGIGLASGPIGFDYGYRFHPYLGGTHAIGLRWHSY